MKLLVPILVLTGSLALSDAQEAGIVLKPKLEAGKTYRYRQDVDATMALPIPGAGDSKTKMTMDMSLQVKAADGGNKEVTTSFDRIAAQIKMAGQDMIYDSTDKTKQSPLLKASFGALTEDTYTAVYDADDNFVELKGVAGGGGAALGMGMGSAEIEQMLRQLTDQGFPEAPVQPGEKWDDQQEAKMGQMGTMTMDLEYTYNGLIELEGHRVADIDIAGTVASDPGAAGLMTFKDSTLSGKLYFDPEVGAVRKSSMAMEMTLSITGTEEAMDMKTTTTSSLLGVE